MIERSAEAGKMLPATVAYIAIALENPQAVLRDVVEVSLSLLVNRLLRRPLRKFSGLDQVYAPRNLFGQANEVWSAFSCGVAILTNDFLLFEATQSVLHSSIGKVL